MLAEKNDNEHLQCLGVGALVWVWWLVVEGSASIYEYHVLATCMAARWNRILAEILSVKLVELFTAFIFSVLVCCVRVCVCYQCKVLHTMAHTWEHHSAVEYTVCDCGSPSTISIDSCHHKFSIRFSIATVSEAHAYLLYVCNSVPLFSMELANNVYKSKQCANALPKILYRILLLDVRNVSPLRSSRVVVGCC